jgi:phosphoglycerate dehydrogenase-like enzyme
MARVAVLDDWQGVAEGLADWSALKARAEVVFFREATPDADALVRALAGFDVVLAMRERTALPGSTIRRLKDLRLLTFTGIANAAVDVPACTAQGVLVCNTVARLSLNGAAELAFGLLLACARLIPQADRHVRAGGFQDGIPPGMDLRGHVLGLVGLGRVGGRVARYAQAFDMQVIACDPHLSAEEIAKRGATKVDLATLLAQADAVSLHCTRTPETIGLLGAAEIGRMKPGAILVNTSRGPVVDEAALLAALREGRIVAGLDVYGTEPLPAEHPLRSAPNTVLTPHLGYVTQQNMAQMYAACIENMLAWLDGAPINVVNPEVRAAT